MKRKIQPVQVYVSTVIDASIENVWMTVRDFNALPQWHPEISESQVEEGLDSRTVGCIRRFSVEGGGEIREQLLELSDRDYRFAYVILESGLGLLDYVAEFALLPVTDGDRTFAAWSANFVTEPGMEEEKSKMVAQDVSSEVLRRSNGS